MSDIDTDRRGLFALGAAAAGVSLIGAGPARAAGGGDGWAPAIEAQDAWMEVPTHRHRLIFDTTEAKAAGEALGYAGNYFRMSKGAYGLKPEEIGMIVVLRHASTPFGYNDAIWKKYGATFQKYLKLEGRDAKLATSRNPLLASPDDKPEKDKELRKAPIIAFAGNGGQFAVCGLATEGIAMELAGKTGDADAIEAELKANLVPGAHIVPAGIVALGHAQERGYAFAYIA